MTTPTICFYSATGGELGVVARAQGRLRAEGVNVDVVGRTREQIADPARALAFARTAATSDVVVVSLHGGTASCPAWPQLTRLWAAMREAGGNLPWIHIQPASRDDDGVLASQEWSTGIRRDSRDPDHTWQGILALLNAGGPDNTEAALRVLADRAAEHGGAVPEPVPAPNEGIWHPRLGTFSEYAEYRPHLRPGAPTVAMLFPRSYWLEHNTAHIEALVDAVEQLGGNALPIFCYRYKDAGRGNLGISEILDRFCRDERGDRAVDAVIDVHGMSILSVDPDAADAYPRFGLAVLHALTSYAPLENWLATEQGMASSDVSTQAAQPEFDGNLITKILATRQTDILDEATGAMVPRMMPIPGRAGAMAELALGWARLARTPNAQKKVAIVFHHHPPRNDRIGCATGLDTFESVRLLLARMTDAGYRVPELFEDADQLAGRMLASLTCDSRWLTPEQMHDRAEAHAGLETTRAWYRDLPESVRAAMDRNWGPHPGALFVHDGEMSFAGHLDGNVLLTIQPPRGAIEAAGEQQMHDPVLPPPHHYLAHYRWIRDVFGADVVIHVGTHGSLEWLPGKALGLSHECYPELALDRLPNIYPYIVSNPGEGTQAKRRSAAALVDHLPPMMRQAGLYDQTAEVDTALREYATAASQGSPERAARVAARLWDAVAAAGLDTDLGADRAAALADPEALADHVNHYLMELADRQIFDGLHVLGKVASGHRDPHHAVAEYMAQLCRLPNGDVPSLREGVLAARGTTVEQAAAADRDGLAQAHRCCVDMLALVERAHRHGVTPSQEDSRELAARICRDTLGAERPDVITTLTWAATDLLPRLNRTGQEIDSVMTALNGGFVRPGPSGAPTRGNAQVLPTGRNFYSLDPATMPTSTAWTEGTELARQLLDEYVAEHPEDPWPQTVGIVVWGTANMRTGGADVAEILYLMGLRPRWESNGRVAGLEVIGRRELGRPRIDVSPRVSGLFRDAFPNLMELIDRGVRMVAALAEPDDDNLLRAHVLADEQELRRQGVDPQEARRKASLRIFGCPPGGYGAGVEELVETKKWSDRADLGRAYSAASAHAYGEGVYGDVETDRFAANLARMDVTVKNEDSREYDMLSCTDFYNYYGGLIAAATTVRGQAPTSLVGDSSDPARIATRTTTQEARLVMRSRILNPIWIQGLQRHGYKGAGDLSKVLDVLIGWDATADVVDDGLWERVARRYALDPEMQEWFRKVNPHALHNIIGTLLDAAQRGLWDADQGTVDDLVGSYTEIEGDIEELSDRPDGERP